MAVVTNKIGFHTGNGGDHERLEAYFSELDAAKIPFVIKSVDDYQPIEMGLAFDQAEHLFVYRLSTLGQDNEVEFDVPLTDRSPSDAATIHWNELDSLLPENFDRARVWLEPIITPDPEKIEWMGQFAVAYADIALREGFKLLMFSWNTSTPALEDWQQESILAYLRLCAEHPDQLGVALKEFSFDPNDIWTERGFRIGYFNQLFDACDLNGIARPTVVLTEWGWSSVDMPDAELALEQIREVNELYGQYPEILGAALWRLGSGSKNLSNQVERLLPLLIRFSTQWSAEIEPDLPVSDITLSVEIDPRPSASPDPTAEATIATETEEADLGTLSVEESTLGQRSNLRYVADVTIPDHSPTPAGQAFVKTWRVRNSGETIWGPDHRLVFLRGNQMGAADSVGVPRIPPNGVGEISVEMVAPRDVRGRTFGDWQMVDPLGNRVGDVLYLILNVTEPIPDTTGTDDSIYRADVTVPDDT
ncbi:MAG: NBR1-Ig-like domain-containing protein, partial [Chloroflexota bacterium]